MYWLNGEFFPTGTLAIGDEDRGLLLGEGIFDTLLAENGQLIDWSPHLTRLLTAADFFGIAAPYDGEILQSAAQALTNQLQKPRTAIRITATGGDGGRGLTPSRKGNPTWLLQATEAPAIPASLSLFESTIIRHPALPSSRHKTTNYLDLLTARKQALAAGHDAALLCNGDGHIVCTCAANLFIAHQQPLADAAATRRRTTRRHPRQTATTRDIPGPASRRAIASPATPSPTAKASSSATASSASSHLTGRQKSLSRIILRNRRQNILRRRRNNQTFRIAARRTNRIGNRRPSGNGEHQRRLPHRL